MSCKYLCENNKDKTTVNLSTGKGHSVLDVIKRAENITGNQINFKIAKRRKGDPSELVAISH